MHRWHVAYVFDMADIHVRNFKFSTKYYVYTYYWYSIFVAHPVVDRHAQYRSTDKGNTSLGRIFQKI